MSERQFVIWQFGSMQRAAADYPDKFRAIAKNFQAIYYGNCF
jgi:hypothetical protein